MSRVSKDLMAVSKCCSFGPIMGSDCSFDHRDAKRSIEIIPLTACKKEISNHKSTWAFSGIANSPYFGSIEDFDCMLVIVSFRYLYMHK